MKSTASIDASAYRQMGEALLAQAKSARAKGQFSLSAKLQSEGDADLACAAKMMGQDALGGDQNAAHGGVEQDHRESSREEEPQRLFGPEASSYQTSI